MKSREILAQKGSNLSKVRIESGLPRHADKRRKLVEVFSSSDINITDAKIIDILAQKEGEKVVIGGHWEKGLEIQYVLSGKIAQLDLADVETTEETTFFDIESGSRIILPAGIAHRLTFEEPSQLLVCNEVPFVPEKCVIYPYETPHPASLPPVV